jgi:DNA-binding ferritin-like protein (Dps family)
MYYPIDRKKCYEEALVAKIENNNRRGLMLASVKGMLETYKRRTLDKWLEKHLKNLDPTLVVSVQKPSYEGSFHAILLWSTNPDWALSYNDREQILPHTYEEFVDSINKRLEGINKYKAELLDISMHFDEILDRYEAAAKEVDAVTNIPGIGCLGDYVKGLRY